MNTMESGYTRVKDRGQVLGDMGPDQFTDIGSEEVTERIENKNENCTRIGFTGLGTGEDQETGEYKIYGSWIAQTQAAEVDVVGEDVKAGLLSVSFAR